MSVVTVDRGSERFNVSKRTAAGRLKARSGRLLSLGLIMSGDALAVVAAIALAAPTPSEALVYGLALVLALGATMRPRVNLTALTEIPRHLVSTGATLVALATGEALLLRLFDVGDGVSSEAVLLTGAAGLLIPFGRSLSYGAIRTLRRRRIAYERALVVGTDEIATFLARTLETHAELGLEPAGFVDDVDPAGSPAPLLGGLDSLDEVIERHSVRLVIVAFATASEQTLVRVLRATMRRRVEVYVVPRLHEMARAGRMPVETVECLPLQRIRPAATTLRAWPAKRIFDVTVAGGALLVLTPLLAVVALVVRLGSPGPVLFRQARVGQHGRTFELLKFRSMRVNDDADVRWSVAGDDRQTPAGRWMRRFSVDELPQLLNVVRGDMSLIGPRPERPHFVEQFSDSVHGYADRHRVPVGLTGWAQINGLRGDTSIADRARFDNHYIDHWSLLRDLSILVATVGAVVRDGRQKHSA